MRNAFTCNGELARPQLGGEVVASRLADVLVVQAIRTWTRRDPPALTGWLQAIQDRRIGAALEKMHDPPGEDWTLDRLARAGQDS